MTILSFGIIHIDNWNIYKHGQSHFLSPVLLLLFYYLIELADTSRILNTYVKKQYPYHTPCLGKASGFSTLCRMYFRVLYQNKNNNFFLKNNILSSFIMWIDGQHCLTLCSFIFIYDFIHLLVDVKFHSNFQIIQMHACSKSHFIIL